MIIKHHTSIHAIIHEANNRSKSEQYMVLGNAQPADLLLRLGIGAATAEVGSVLYATRD